MYSELGTPWLAAPASSSWVRSASVTVRFCTVVGGVEDVVEVDVEDATGSVVGVLADAALEPPDVADVVDEAAPWGELEQPAIPTPSNAGTTMTARCRRMCLTTADTNDRRHGDP